MLVYIYDFHLYLTQLMLVKTKRLRGRDRVTGVSEGRCNR